jgi:hypothetical protein
MNSEASSVIARSVGLLKSHERGIGRFVSGEDLTPLHRDGPYVKDVAFVCDENGEITALKDISGNGEHYAGKIRISLNIPWVRDFYVEECSLEKGLSQVAIKNVKLAIKAYNAQRI